MNQLAKKCTDVLFSWKSTTPLPSRSDKLRVPCRRDATYFSYFRGRNCFVAKARQAEEEDPRLKQKLHQHTNLFVFSIHRWKRRTPCTTAFREFTILRLSFVLLDLTIFLNRIPIPSLRFFFLQRVVATDEGKVFPPFFSVPPRGEPCALCSWLLDVFRCVAPEFRAEC